MQGNYKVITLCGSTRFKDQFQEAQKRLTLEGNIVISVGLFGHSGDKEVWEGMEDGTLTETKEMLDDMHKRKIDMADEIYVINVGGYIGESTRSEIEYAKRSGKSVRYLEETSLEDIREMVIAISGGVDPKTGETIDMEQLLRDEAVQNSINKLYKSMLKMDTGSQDANEKEDHNFERHTAHAIKAAPVHKLIIEADVLKQEGRVDDAIALLKRALENNQNLQQRSLIIGDVIKTYIKDGRTEEANHFYIQNINKHGNSVVDSATLTLIAKLLLDKNDKVNARNYAAQAYRLCGGKCSNALNEVVTVLQENGSKKKSEETVKQPAKKATTYRATKPTYSKEKKAATKKPAPRIVVDTEETKQFYPKEEETIERSCSNCKLYKNEDCAGFKGLCDDYEYAPIISEEEKKNWPTEMGPYVTGYGNKRRRGR